MKPISKTAFYTAGIRMLDARVKRPICNDTLAHVFMNDEGMAILNQTRHLLGPRITTVQRHKIIDDILNELLHKNNKLQIILIGAGFDTRAYRLPGGNWIELDEPEIMAYKEQKLPALECPHPLQRIAIQFAHEPLIEKLRPFATYDQVVVIYEGVMMYLSEKQIDENIKVIQQIFSNHLLICDLITRAFFHLFSRKLHRQLSELGASFQFKHYNKPQQFFTQKNYAQLRQISIPQTAVAAGNLVIPPLIYFLFKNVFITGYTVNVFEYRR
jgi:methyltransferase (TIGR00027 family)